MKILLITLEYLPQIGGIASYITNTIKHWPNDNDSFVVCAPKIDDEADFDAKNFWPVYRLEPYFNLIRPRWLKLFWSVFKIVKKEKPDMIFVHHVLPIGQIARLIKKFKKIPYVVFLHGLDYGYAQTNLVKKKRLTGVLSEAQTVVVNSNYLRQRVANQFSALASKTVVVYPCSGYSDVKIDPIKLEEMKKKFNPAGRPVLLTCGRLVARKGVDMVIKSLPAIIKSRPDLLYLVGGQGKCRAELMYLARRLGMENHIKFIGFVDDSDLPYLYSLADIFVMPARQEDNGDIEGFGIVLMEASLFGLPVIAGNTGGQPEAVENGQTGILVDPMDTGQISLSVLKLLQDKELAQRLGRNGQEKAKRFIWSKELKKIFK
ncbi:MAG: hypothetical protein COU31_03105 [Candidatus Magasanikbacteria bacterium CG10_big_fil_rev_8_21_14_0_10_40_10]|uniref:Glycosyltransferase family 1 protein n=1 Tax=Candidatus Magasanikbacteria bacterium CG10_big_fil_rev_8_21_14_0_10_40_10 TaxID=1974648 RepID=A0A2M6W3M5_9BACT|nr:MAG: hypothetical protein COU31_03105 [Candidatus Magasanikbacteria bacterium CG10_big_fil_rev_8_21_14_0_10_40_10]